ncbi:MAG: hypothetical protein JO112_20130 [Planctomycetes bacterium]|nr:hypothetical protein [Planctomycetota bacterium]
MTGESREDLVKRIRSAADRGAVLALENQGLHAQLENARFARPKLWRDEVTALKTAIEDLKHRFIHVPLDGKKSSELANIGYDMQALQALLDRCEHCPVTRDEFNEQVSQVVLADDAEWFPSDEDGGTDIDGEWWGHFNPPPGYAPCTIKQWPHEGPCAHPLDKRNCDHRGHDFNYGPCFWCGAEGCPA